MKKKDILKKRNWDYSNNFQIRTIADAYGVHYETYKRFLLFWRPLKINCYYKGIMTPFMNNNKFNTYELAEEAIIKYVNKRIILDTENFYKERAVINSDNLLYFIQPITIKNVKEKDYLEGYNKAVLDIYEYLTEKGNGLRKEIQRNYDRLVKMYR